MANYQNLKAAISAAIRTNGNQEITGQVLQDVLNSIVSVIGANYTFAGVATPATNPGTPDQNVMYLAMEGGTYTNFSGMVLPAGISLLMWNGTWTSETVMCGDGGVFDISVYKSSGGTLATFADLSAALNGGNNIPVGARKGGMSVKFVQSSDNKYAQYRLMADNWSTDTEDWAIADEGVYVENPEFIYVKTDREGKILWAIKTEGNIYYGAGVPPQVVEYIKQNIKKYSLEEIVVFLDGLEKETETLRELLDGKVSSEADKSLIDSIFASGVYYDEISGLLEMVLDKEDDILSYREIDGTIHENCNAVFHSDFMVEGNVDSPNIRRLEHAVIYDNHIYKYIGKYPIDFSSNDLNKPFRKYYGEGVDIQTKGTLTPLKQFYSCGTAQADIRAVTYEDGSPIIENNSIFLSVSSRTGGAGPTILRYNIGTCEMEMVGVIITSIAGSYWHGAAAHVMFNRNTGQWQVTLSGHRLNHLLFYGLSYSDLRYGVNYVTFSSLNYDTPSSGDEDPQIIYNTDDSYWYLIYSKDSLYTEVQRGNSPVGPFTHYASSNINSTGITTTKVGGHYYCIHGSQKDQSVNRYVWESFPELSTNGNLSIDIDDGAYRGWGTVVPVPDGEKTSYLFFTFDRLVSSDEDNWTYGALYIYRAAEENAGIEFDIENMGISIPSNIVETYSIAQLNFKRINAQRNVFDMSMLLSQLKLNADVLLSNSNIYKQIGNCTVSMGENKINVAGTGEEILIGGVHHPYSCYSIELTNMGSDETRFLYIGDDSGDAVVKVLFKKVGSSIRVSAIYNDNETLIGMMSSNSALVAFSGSCLTSSDNIYIYSY